MHVHQHMAMERPVPHCIRRKVERDLCTRQNIDDIFARILALLPVHHLKEMAVQMDRVRHHRVVDEVYTHPLIMPERQRLGFIGIRLPVH